MVKTGEMSMLSKLPLLQWAHIKKKKKKKWGMVANSVLGVKLPGSHEVMH